MSKILVVLILLILIVTLVVSCTDIGKDEAELSDNEEKEVVEDVSVDLDELSKGLDSVSEDLG